MELFPHDQKLEVEITLADEDWEQLAAEGRSINEVFSGCPSEDFEYTKFRAQVRIGERTFDDVSVRKKGFLGSVSGHKPGLRIDLDEYVPGQRLSGTSAITLNNSASDRSYTHQCMSYAAFAQAGIPAPRCSFAEVTVNGASLGTYVNVEPIKKPFLAAHFDSNEGDLYEGTVADFRSDMLAGFEKKTNESAPQGPELAELASALTLPDDELVERVEELIDLEQFLRFWALETLVGHWDGYSGDLNNFFIYVDPTSGKIHFIPWGTDTTYSEDHLFLPTDGWPKSAYAWARLPRRLYEIEATRERYRAELGAQIEALWDEPALLAEVDRIAELVGSDADPGALEAQRAFIRGRRATLLEELDAPAIPWTVDERAMVMCRPEAISDIRATFTTTWGDLANESAFVGNTLESVASPAMPLFTLAGAGVSADPAAPGKALRITQAVPEGGYIVLQLMLGAPTIEPGELHLHGFETYGVLLRSAPPELTVLGYAGEGTITFEAVGTDPDAEVVGEFVGKLVSLR